MGMFYTISIHPPLLSKDGATLTSLQTKNFDGMETLYLRDGRLYGPAKHRKSVFDSDDQPEEEFSVEDSLLVITSRRKLRLMTEVNDIVTAYSGDPAEANTVYTIGKRYSGSQQELVEHHPWVSFSLTFKQGVLVKSEHDEHSQNAVDLRVNLKKQGLQIIERDDPRFELLLERS